jgi:hypothetical protein
VGYGMNLNDLLVSKGFSPSEVLALRHRPHEPQLTKVLPWLAAEKPDLFNAYQQNQGSVVEKSMSRAAYVASFIGHGPGKALFIGLYKHNASFSVSFDRFWSMPANAALKPFGYQGFTEDENRSHCLWFELAPTDFHAEWKGKLIVRWSPPGRAWFRWAGRNDIVVDAILEDSALDAAMPQWDQIELAWKELGVLPTRWKGALAQWRGIYYIFDTTDGKGYVGSAYGETNLLGRWLGYAATGHGGNRLLRMRKPEHFRFTILQRLSPDMPAADVIRLESTWKDRLHTRPPFGLNDN